MTDSPAYDMATFNTASDSQADRDDNDELYEIPYQLTKTDMDGR